MNDQAHMRGTSDEDICMHCFALPPVSIKYPPSNSDSESGRMLLQVPENVENRHARQSN